MGQRKIPSPKPDLRNKVNRVSLTIQYLNQVFDNKEQLINIDIVYLFSFSC